MKKILTVLECKMCNKKYSSNIIVELNLPDDKEYISKVKDFSIYTSCCPLCKKDNFIYFPINIIDEKRKFALLSDKSLEKKYKDYKVRIVNNGMELVEKYQIFTQHLDEQVIETINATLLRNLKIENKNINLQYMYCSGKTNNKVNFSNPSLSDIIQIDYKAILQLEKVLKDKNLLIDNNLLPKTKELLYNMVEERLREDNTNEE